MHALLGHSFCFFGTDCLEVRGQLGRLAGSVVEDGNEQDGGSGSVEEKEGSAL